MLMVSVSRDGAAIPKHESLAILPRGAATGVRGAYCKLGAIELLAGSRAAAAITIYSTAASGRQPREGMVLVELGSSSP
jgi:hypothetical protein